MCRPTLTLLTMDVNDYRWIEAGTFASSIGSIRGLVNQGT